jgi:membrane fusion protein, macrolide-specific efflux system
MPEGHTEKRGFMARSAGRSFLFLIAIILIAGAIFVLRGHKQHEAASPEGEFVTVTRGDIEETVTAQGKIEPKTYVDVGAQVSGQLKSVVDIGVVVKKGDLLAEIDPRIYQSKVESDQARIKTLQAQLVQQEAQADLAQKQAARNQELIKANAVSKEAVEQTDSALKVAQASVTALKAQIEEQQSGLSGDQTNLSYTKIFSPMDGTVVSQSVKQGQTVNSSQQAPTIVQVADLDIMTVRAQVAEADVMKLREGMDIYFTTLGSQERKWNAKIRQILPTPQTVNDVVLFNVLVDVDNKDRQLMTGMSTQMFFVVGQAKGALLLPVGALGRHIAHRDSDAGDAYMVKVMKGPAPENTLIHVGLMDRNVAEVRDGLSEGDKVMNAQPKAAGGDQDRQRGGGGGRGGRGFGGGPRL